MIWIFRALAANVIVTFAVTGFAYVLQFYEEAALDAVRGLRRPVDRARLAAGLGAWARESGCNLAVWLVWPLGILPRPRIRPGAWLPVKGETRHGRPVLVVHGYGMNRGCMQLLTWRLERTRRPVLAIDFPWGKTIEQLGETLAAGANELKGATGADKIDLVCHSRGGVIAHWWIHKMGGAAHVDRVVTLGSPFGGTKLAAFGVGPSVLQLFPGSELQRTLASTPLDPGVTFYAVNGEADAMMLPPGTDELRPPGRNIRLSGLGHCGLLFSAGAWLQVHAALRRTAEDGLSVTGFDDETDDQAAARAIANFGR